jgi:DNA repair protein RecO (recombination protein O)
MTTQPAWVLSRKNYGDNGLLVEFFTLDMGRCGAIVRGAHRRKRGGSLAALLQPFCPLLITLAGRGDLKTLRMAEAPTVGYSLSGEILMSGLYLNELLVRTLPRFDVLPSLFMSYGRAIESLRAVAGEESLRRFELELLAELGYRIDWQSSACGKPIKPDYSYLFETDRGFCIADDQVKQVPGEVLLAGSQVMNLKSWWESEAELTHKELAALKRITRGSVSQLTGGRVLHTREYFKQLKSRTVIDP